jgi:hypothetical protein
MTKIFALPPDAVASNWQAISGYLIRVIETGQGESTLTDYLRKCLNNQAVCWVVMSNSLSHTGQEIVGVGLTEILQYSQHKTLHIIAFSGDNFDEQAQVFPTIIQYAKDCGCKSIEQWGRKGWAKVLPKYIPEFKEVYTVMRIDL